MENSKKRSTGIGEILYRFRYLIIVVVFAVSGFLELSGSSISMWEDFIGIQSQSGDGDLFGQARMIRSDEWAVNTPMAFSQYFAKDGSFPYFSETLRGAKTDAFIVYGQPVLSWEVIFRPFQWGYLLFAPARGLSFFWCGRFLALLMISFELGMYLFNRRKSYAVAYSALLSLSPVVQWWFAINGLVEMLVFGQAVLLIVSAYFNQRQYWKKILLALGLAWCGGCYILVFYPPWQIPLGYVFLFLLIGITAKEYKKDLWCWKKDIPVILGALLILGIAMGAIVCKSWNTIQTVMNTAYPGTRSFAGGGALRKLFNWAQGILYPFMEPAFGGTNVCEEASVISFFPLGILVGLWVLIKEKKRDAMLISLLTGTVFLTAYCVLPWPEILAKATLLSNCQPDRAVLAVGFISLILLLYASVISEKAPGKAAVGIVGVFFAGGTMVFLYKSLPELYVAKRQVAAVCVILTVSLILVGILWYKWKSTVFAWGCIVLAVLNGAFVNPIHKGVDVIYTNPLVQAVAAEADSDDKQGLWIVENIGFPCINIPIMTGAPTINCTNTYPVLERWKKLDSTGIYEDTYNRYVHIFMQLKEDGETVFENPQTAPDHLNITLPAKELKTLNVKHILTNRDLSEFESDNVKFKLKNQVGNYRIYDVITQE